MTTTTAKWVHGLASATITGITTSFMSALGVSGSNMVGVQVEQFSGKQLAVVCVFGGLVGMAAYLKQSPLPTSETTIVVATSTTTTTHGNEGDLPPQEPPKAIT